MNFYEIHDPCYAVIAAKTKEQSLEVYTECMGEVADKARFFEQLTLLDEQVVIDRLTETVDEGQTPITREEAERIVKEVDFDHGDVVLMDERLI